MKKNKHDEIVWLEESKFSSIEILTSKTLIDSNSSHDEFLLLNIALKEFYNKKEEFKNSN